MSSFSSQVQHSQGSTPYGNGYLTRWGTFQTYWTELSFREYVEEVTTAKAKRLGKGILVLKKE